MENNESNVIEYLYIGCEDNPMALGHTCFNAATISGEAVGREEAEGLLGNLDSCPECGSDIVEKFETINLPPRPQVTVEDIMDVFESTNGFVALVFGQLSDDSGRLHDGPELHVRLGNDGFDWFTADGFPEDFEMLTRSELRQCLNRYPYEFRTIDATAFNDGSVEQKLLKPN